jgi:hypothetical protein
MARRLVTLTDEDILYIKKSMESQPAFWTVGKKIIAKLERSQTQIKTASAKQKGRSLQYFVCEKLSALLGIPWSQDDDAEISSRPMGQHGVDIILRGRARELAPFAFECKAVKALRFADAVEQADGNASGDQIGAVVYRAPSQQPVVILSWNSFEKVLGRYIIAGSSK